MFNFGPSMEMMRKFLPQQGPPSGMPMPGGMDAPPPPDMGGGMPSIDVGPFQKFPGMPPMGDGGMGPRMPRIIDGPMPTFPGNPGPMQPPMQGGGDGPMRKPMFGGMANKMSTDRPGFWGKFNTIAQGLQPMAMNMLRGNQPRRQGY